MLRCLPSVRELTRLEAESAKQFAELCVTGSLSNLNRAYVSRQQQVRGLQDALAAVQNKQSATQDRVQNTKLFIAPGSNNGNHSNCNSNSNSSNGGSGQLVLPPPASGPLPMVSSGLMPGAFQPLNAMLPAFQSPFQSSAVTSTQLALFATAPMLAHAPAASMPTADTSRMHAAMALMNTFHQQQRQQAEADYQMQLQLLERQHFFKQQEYRAQSSAAM